MQHHGMQGRLLRYCQVLAKYVHTGSYPEMKYCCIFQYRTWTQFKHHDMQGMLLDTAKCLHMVCTLILDLHCKMIFHIRFIGCTQMQHHGMQNILLRYCQVLAYGVQTGSDTPTQVVITYLSNRDAHRCSTMVSRTDCSDYAMC